MEACSFGAGFSLEAFALAFAAITVVSWRYLFIIPIALSIAITVCLTAAAWVSGKQVVPRSL